MKTDLFQSCDHCWLFQICWHIECSLYTASSFRIWNSSTEIPSPPLALFIVILPKAHLTSHSRMSGLGEWSHHHSHLDHEDFFLYNSSVYSWNLFLICSASVRSISFLSFFEPIFAWNVPFLSPIFLNCASYFSLKNSPWTPGCFAWKYLGAHSFPCDLLLCYVLTGVEISLLSNQIRTWVVNLRELPCRVAGWSYLLNTSPKFTFSGSLLFSLDWALLGALP